MGIQQDDGHVPVNGTASLYVNYFELAHNRYEFLVEFGQYRPGREAERGMSVIHTRLALSPPYAKMLSELLTKATAEHEKAHGPIASIAEHSTPFDIVLHSLPEFEDRAKQLRAKARNKSDRRPPSSNSIPFKTGDT